MKEAKVSIGVGEGNGNFFVEGDYDSIVHLQKKLFELEDLRRQVRKYKKFLKEKDLKIEED
jgi:hypothetical protein